jgi:small subunit ribosomal protein S15
VLSQAREAAQRKYQKNANDVGSSQVQVAQLTETVNYLTKHVQTNPRDYSARRGLLRAVNLRRKCVIDVLKHCCCVLPLPSQCV